MYHQDANGNVVALSGASGSLVEKYEYLPGRSTSPDLSGVDINNAGKRQE